MNRFANLTAFATIGTALALAAIDPLPASAAGGNEPPPPDDILRGPIVSDEASRSLVSKDMAGRFVRIEGRPEEAAVPLLVLEPGAREAAMRVLDARFEAIREHVIDQIDLLRETSDAVRAGDSKRAAIRDAVIACVKESRLRPTGEARLALARAILAELSPEQREKGFAAALGAL